MVRVFVLNCELASLKGFAPWEKHVFLQCVTEDHRSVHVVINKHFHHTLSLRVAESDQHRVANMDRDELQGQMSSFLEQMGCNPRYPPVTDVELTFRTPLVGFTNMRRDPIIELTLSNPSKQYKVLGALEENDMVFGDIEIAAAVDPKNIGSQFMQQHDVRIYSWCELDVPVQSIGLRPNGRLPARAWYGDYVLPLQLNRNRGGATYLVAPTRLRTCAEQPPPLVPTTLFLRTHAVSSTAVFGNVYAPSAELAGDVVKTIVCTVATADGKTEEIVLSNDDDDDEKGLLDRFVRLLCERSVQVVVQSSEIRDDLLYLARRAQRHKLQILSSVHGCDSYISEFNGKVIDLVHLGRVRVDVAQVLQKLMVSPPLGGYTLLSALAHPKIVRDKSRHAFLDDLAYMPSNVFSSAEEIEHDLRCNVRLLRDVYEDASMLLNNGNVARTCDLPIRKVVERGQQARVMGCIRRKMFDNKVTRFFLFF